ncbi:BTAD domain-containing putative transcriptional regulator [Actinosynnema sp. NPDC059335]|uniref:AfsR/SARP family transcriptional regulator n=1 Tax=Actinosynnema sp. NPDC059335 TaxID=3346804 RepID=UPI003672B4D7
MGASLRFNILGPVEVLSGGRPLTLGGAKQRATLALLLMNPNRVVATRRLLQALWVEEEPKTARKILQNAVWSLRNLLGEGADADEQVELRTQAPGYMLRVEQEKVDMHWFLRLVREGRAELASGSPEVAASLLGKALALWRGPAMADLVDTCATWPELTALENARLDVTEDYFDAELACGRHRTALDELALVVEQEPLRERRCGQLMLALYRSGRQADALQVYRRTRAELVDNLGLEPSQQLQSLQQAILNHDPELARVAPPGVSPAPVVVRPRRPVTTPHPVPAPRPRPEPEAPGVRQVGILMIRARSDDHDDRAADLLAEIIPEVVARFDGTITTSIGSMSLALFDIDETEEDPRMVCAAAAIRQVLADDPRTAGRGVSFHAAVVTGKIRVSGAARDLHAVAPASLDECATLLAHVPAGEIWVCATTRSASSAVTYDHVVFEHAKGDAFAAWQVRERSPAAVGAYARKGEIGLLHDLLGWVGTWSRPHLVTVLGAAGTGKSRLIEGFARSVSRTDQAHVVTLRCGGGPSGEATRALVEAFGGLPTHAHAPRHDLAAGALDVPPGGRFVDRMSLNRPAVVLIDDLHLTDDSLLDLLDDMTGSRRALPLLVVVATDLELLGKRPQWGMGRSNTTTIPLDLPGGPQDTTRRLAPAATLNYTGALAE